MEIKKALEQAVELAVVNVLNNHGGPFGAVILKDNKIIGTGVNEVTVCNDPTAHAEIQAIRSACKQLGTFDLTGSLLLASCEPCPMCLAAAYWARVDKIYFAATRHDAEQAGFDDHFIYEQISLPYEERHLPMVPILDALGQKPFEVWKSKSDKIPY